MSIYLTNFPETYDRDIETKIFDGLGETPAPWREYFNVSTGARYIESITAYSGLGQMGEWKDGQPLPLDEPVDLYDFTITQTFYGMGIKLGRKFNQYSLNPALGLQWARGLGRSLGQKYGVVHAAILGNAFTTTYSSLGSVALISASHTAAGGATRSNINSSAALTPANLEVLRVQGWNAINYRGLADPHDYTKLIIPPALRRTAAKILGGELESGTANNDINTQRGALRPLVDPFLTAYSTTAYYVQGEVHGLQSMHGQLPTPDQWDEQSTKSAVFELSADFAVGVEFFEGIAGSQGA